MLKEDVSYAENANHLIKQNVLHQNVNIQLKIINQLQNT